MKTIQTLRIWTWAVALAIFVLSSNDVQAQGTFQCEVFNNSCLTHQLTACDPGKLAKLPIPRIETCEEHSATNCPTGEVFECRTQILNPNGFFHCTVYQGNCITYIDATCPSGTSTLLPNGTRCEDYASSNCPTGGGHSCRNPSTPPPPPLPPGPGGNTGTGGPVGNNPNNLINLDQLTDSINGFKFSSSTTLGDIVNGLLPILFGIAGTALLLYLIGGGFGYLTSSGDPKKMEAAKTVITNAVIGFVIIITAYFITQAVNYIFNLGSPIT